MKKIISALCAASTLFAGLPVPKQLQARFEQTVLNRDANRTLVYGGTVAAKLPDRAKWIYAEPVRKSICLDRDRAWVVEPELEQATLYRLGRAIPLLAIMERAEKIGAARYKARYRGVDYDIEVDEKKRLKSVAYDDDLGNRVVLRFYGVDTSPFDDKKLKCEIPEDYDIIDGRF